MLTWIKMRISRTKKDAWSAIGSYLVEQRRQNRGMCT